MDTILIALSAASTPAALSPTVSAGEHLVCRAHVTDVDTLRVGGVAVRLKGLVDRIQRLIPSLGGDDDRIGVGGPDQWAGLGVVLDEVADDGGLEID